MQKSYKSNLVFNFSTEPLNWNCDVCNFVARDNEDNSKPTREVAHKRLNIFIEEV
jgi:hypothetical protein